MKYMFSLVFSGLSVLGIGLAVSVFQSGPVTPITFTFGCFFALVGLGSLAGAIATWTEDDL